MTAPSADAMFRSAFGHDVDRYGAAALTRDVGTSPGYLSAISDDPSPEEVARSFGRARRNGRDWLCSCPVHGAGGGDRSPSLSLATGNNGKLLVKCFAGCDQLAILAEVRARFGMHRDDRPRRTTPLAPPPARDIDAERRRKAALTIWRETRPALGTFVDLWLRDRGIRSAVPAGIRFHQALPYWQDGREVGRWPAMVVGMRGPDGSFVGVHRTYLDDAVDGGPVRKAPVEPARMMLGKAGVAWFGRRDAIAIIAGEGVETVLAASELGRADLPPWGCCSAPDDDDPPPVPAVPAEPYGFTPVACFSAGGLTVFDPPSTVRLLFICEDADEAGRTAASKLAASAHKRSIAVNILRFSERSDGC